MFDIYVYVNQTGRYKCILLSCIYFMLWCYSVHSHYAICNILTILISSSIFQIPILFVPKLVYTQQMLFWSEVVNRAAQCCMYFVDSVLISIFVLLFLIAVPAAVIF